MMRKVRVVKYGQQPAMHKPGYSRGFNSGQFPVYYPGTEWIKPQTEVNSSVSKVPWDEANVEAEGGETVFVPDQGGLPAHFTINGPRHSEGGVPLNLPQDSFIYSDTRKMKLAGPVLEYFGKKPGKRYTPAELAKQYDINKYRKILQNPDSDDIQRHSAELMIQNYNKKLGALALVQEAKKGFPDGVPVASIPFLMTYGLDPQMVLPDIPQMNMPQPPTAPGGMNAGGTTGTWAAPNFYGIGGSYSAQTEPEFGGNWMGKARATKQYDGEQEQLLQVIQMFAQATGQDPDQLLAQLKQMSPDEATQALEQMAQAIQQMQGQGGIGAPSAETQPTGYQYGGSYLPKAQLGDAGIKGLQKYTAGYKDITNIDDLVNAYNRLGQAGENTAWYSWGWFPGSEANQVKDMQLEIAKRIYNIARTSDNSEQRRKAGEALHNLKTSWYSLGWVPGSDEFGIGMRAVAADAASVKLKSAENKKKASYLLNKALPAYTEAYQGIMANPDAYSPEDAKTIADNYNTLLSLQAELSPGSVKMGAGAYLRDLQNIPLVPPQAATAPIISKPRTTKKGTVPFTTVDSTTSIPAAPAAGIQSVENKQVTSPVSTGTMLITGRERDSILKAKGLIKKAGGSLPKAQLGDAIPVDGGYMLPIDPVSGLPVTNLPEFTVQAEDTPMTSGTGSYYNPVEMFNKAYREGRIATGSAEDMGASDPAALLAGAAFKIPQVAGSIMNFLRRDSDYKKWADEAGTPLPSPKERYAGIKPRVAKPKSVAKSTSKPITKTKSAGKSKDIGIDDPSQYYKYAERPGTPGQTSSTRIPMSYTRPSGVLKPDASKFINLHKFTNPTGLGYHYIPVDTTNESPYINEDQLVTLDTSGIGTPYVPTQDTLYPVQMDTLPGMPDTIPGTIPSIVPTDSDTIRNTLRNDSLLKAWGFQYGGNVRKFQEGGEDDDPWVVEKVGNQYNIRYKGPDGTLTGPLTDEQIEQIKKGLAAKQTAAKQPAAAGPATAAATASAPATTSKVKSYDPSNIDPMVKAVLEKAGVEIDESITDYGVISRQKKDPQTGEYIDVETGKTVPQTRWLEKNQWYLEDRKKRGLPDYDPNNKEHVSDFEEAYNKKTEEDVYNELIKRNATPDEARTAAQYVVKHVGFSDDPTAINYKDKIHGNFHKLREPFKFKEVKKTPAPTPVADSKPIKKGEEAKYVAQPGYAPYWLQDLVNLYGATGDFLRLKKYLPWLPNTEPVVPSAVFHDPTRALGANAEQAAIASQAASAFSGPQQLSSRLSGIQGKASEQAANIAAQYSNMNVPIANQYEAMKAGIYNQANEKDARRAAQLYDGVVVANQQFDNARAGARDNMRQAYITALTNRAQTQALNTMYPDYYVDPSLGGFVYHIPGVRTMDPRDNADRSDFESWRQKIIQGWI